jgi:hypothetical protein
MPKCAYLLENSEIIFTCQLVYYYRHFKVTAQNVVSCAACVIT